MFLSLLLSLNFGKTLKSRKTAKLTNSNAYERKNLYSSKSRI